MFSAMFAYKDATSSPRWIFDPRGAVVLIREDKIYQKYYYYTNYTAKFV